MYRLGVPVYRSWRTAPRTVYTAEERAAMNVGIVCGATFEVGQDRWSRGLAP